MAAAARDERYEPTEEEVTLALRWHARRAAEARGDPAALFEFVMREETSRARLRIAPHQELILAFVLAHPKCVVRAPVGFSKTYLMIALTLFFLGEDCTQRGVVASSVQGQSKKVVGAARTYIESSDELALAFPELLPTRRPGEPWTQVAITVDRPMGIRDPSLVAVGIGGKLPGSRISWALADDLLNDVNTASEEGRLHTRTWVTGSLLDRLDAVDARIVFCNVPWVPKTSPESVGDITYELESEPFSWPTLTLDAHGDIEIRNTDWDTDLIRPAHGPNPEGLRHRLTAHDDPAYAIYAGEEAREGWVDSEDQVPLWPEKFPLAVLDELRRTLGPLDYMRAVRCKPRTALTVAERTAWISACKQAAVVAGRHRIVESLPAGPTRITAIDPAFGKTKKSTRTSILTFEVMPDGRRAVLENQVGRWQGPDIADRTISAVTRFGSIAVVEGNAAQRWMRDIVRLKRKTVPIQTAITGANKGDPRFGVQSIFIELEQGLWLLPNDGRQEGNTIIAGACPEGIQDLVSDILVYDQGEHTGDSLMACVAPGALVTTARGLVPIQEVAEGDTVLTHRSRWRRVTGVASRDYRGPAHRVRASGNPPFILTPEHPVWSALTRMRWIGGERETTQLQPVEWRFREASALRAGRKEAGMFGLSPLPSCWPEVASTRIDLAAFVGRRELAWGGRWHVGDDLLQWRREKSYPRWLDVDEQAAMLIGLYLAEGSVGGSHGVGRVSFALHKREAHLASFVRSQSARLFNAMSDTSDGSGHNGMVVGVRSSLMGRLLRRLGKGEYKAMPWEWMSWPLALRLAVARGWLLGDGTLIGGRISGVSISRALLEQVRLTLFEAGLLPSMGIFMAAGPRSFAGKPGRCRSSWRLSLSRGDTARLLNAGCELERTHWGWSDTPARARSNSRAICCEGGVARRFASIDEFSYQGRVYNLHVDEDESYVVEGLAVHNCWIGREFARKRGLLDPSVGDGSDEAAALAALGAR